MEARGEKVELEQLLREQEIRDQRDAARDLAPMKPAGDAILLDSTRTDSGASRRGDGRRGSPSRIESFVR